MTPLNKHVYCRKNPVKAYWNGFKKFHSPYVLNIGTNFKRFKRKNDVRAHTV